MVVLRFALAFVVANLMLTLGWLYWDEGSSGVVVPALGDLLLSAVMTAFVLTPGLVVATFFVWLARGAGWFGAAIQVALSTVLVFPLVLVPLGMQHGGPSESEVGWVLVSVMASCLAFRLVAGELPTRRIRA